MAVANTRAYNNTATIMAVKSFKVQAPWLSTIKLFTQVSNRNSVSLVATSTLV